MAHKSDQQIGPQEAFFTTSPLFAIFDHMIVEERLMPGDFYVLFTLFLHKPWILDWNGGAMLSNIENKVL